VLIHCIYLKSDSFYLSLLVQRAYSNQRQIDNASMQRAGRRGLKVKDDRVFLMSGKITSGVRAIVGEHYLAKWLHPRQFEDIGPESVHRELVNEFCRLVLEGAYGFPSH